MSFSGLARRALIEREAIRTAKCLLLDWDGCVAIGNKVLPDAAALIARHIERVVILSNNSTDLPSDLAGILQQSGLDLPEDRIFTAGAEAVRIVAARRGARVLLLGSPKMRRLAREMGVDLVRQDADVVLLMRDARFTYAKLMRAANAVRDGAELIATNDDRTHPGLEGRVVPETGALLAALRACLDDTALAPLIIGKPGELLFRRACDHLGIQPSEAVMIGYNPATDGEGALNYGIRPILVGGTSSLQMKDLVEPSPEKMLRTA